ncbi:hypothetical protein E4U03_01645 [Rothia nasimurium]|uniref:Polysaccharide biosynthesis protein n=1 Tax=Rothia nasimurium TaxID=85336 RepID=A0A4Y9F601_9MICC|nr:hypothetical protein [Rothia nasimurium]MBF0807322.1 hypothetical protein [Rothia nasimurium]TFU23837.1 hypothetical protein E4U03_01645 [Rothia nasimurium]
MSEEHTEAVISRGQSLFITASSIISAGTTFLVTWLAARSLTVEDNKDFLVFWSLTSLVFATLLGVQQESARLIGSHHLSKGNSASVSRQRTYNPLVVATWVGLTCALIFAALTPVWLGTVLPAGDWRTVLLITLVTAVYACHVYCIGAMAGTRSWTEYALLISTGGIFCFLCTLLASVAGGGLLAFQLSFLATAFLWLIFMAFSPRVRSATRLRLVGRPGAAYRSMLLAVGTAVAMAAMSTGFPIFLEATSSKAETESDALLAAIILGISITRAPIMMPLQAFQGVAVSYFLAHAQRPTTALLKPVGALLALGAVGAAAAYLLGPWLFDEIYEKYAGQLDGAFLAALTFAAALLAVTTLSGTAALAMGAHRIYLAGWVVTVVVAFGCLLLPLDLETKTIVALMASPVIGAAAHLAGMEVLSRTQASAPAI